MQHNWGEALTFKTLQYVISRYWDQSLHKTKQKLHEPSKHEVKSEHGVGASSKRGKDCAQPAERSVWRGLLLLCALTLHTESRPNQRLHRTILNQTHTHTPHPEKEEERKESEGCVWHYSAAPKIAPWRPGLQLGCHGDRTTGAINRQSAPNLVRLEWGQKEGETDSERKM